MGYHTLFTEKYLKEKLSLDNFTVPDIVYKLI